MAQAIDSVTSHRHRELFLIKEQNVVQRGGSVSTLTVVHRHAAESQLRENHRARVSTSLQK